MKNNYWVTKIAASHSSIYDDPSDLYIPTNDLERILDKELEGLSLNGLPLRTRAKVIKVEICKILHYPAPKIFKKIQPRFPAQNIDIYVQKSNNLQIWNEEVAPDRRYVLIKINNEDIIERVKIIVGEELVTLDKTGTLTQKYQARFSFGKQNTEIVSQNDTSNMSSIVHKKTMKLDDPASDPDENSILDIRSVFSALKQLIGCSFSYSGSDQERNRGAELHRRACRCLGYKTYRDNGQFPDIRNQLLEIKLQTSATIDLGLVNPSSNRKVGIPRIKGCSIKYSDIRYAVFYGHVSAGRVTLTNLYVITGKDFYRRFKQFKGREINRKIQIPLPANFFNG